MIIWLASYPRSGNTYFRMLLNYMCGIKTYSIYNDPLFQEIGAQDTIGHELLPAPIEELVKDKRIYFVKTHDLPMDTNPAIYVVRDGRDALVSYARYLKSFNWRGSRLGRLKQVINLVSFQRMLRNLITSTENFGGWSNNVLAWTKKRKGGFTFAIRCEDLINNPELWLKKAIETLKIKVDSTPKTELPSFDSLHEKWPQFFRKGKLGSWKEEMSEDLHELFWTYHWEAMESFGYKR